MKGYKVFNNDWTCRGFQYEVGKTYKTDSRPILCCNGFHFCEKVADCFDYYSFDPRNKVAEVEALGEVVTADDGRKSCTNEIKIVREVSWEEMLTLANSGKGNTGRNNSGNRNSGDRNSGDCNSGDCNSGDRNSGDYNSGNCNSGDRNSGDCNSGDCNSGNWNSGNWNSGNRNSGNCNSGDRNSGDRNSGNCNSGDCNSGNWNSGDYNSGDWNKTNYSSGYFCTKEPRVLFFDKESDWTHKRWTTSEARIFLMQMPMYEILTYIWYSDMTKEERDEHPEAEATGGYLKKVVATNADRQKWWNELEGYKKRAIMELPNFDEAKFEEITGINTRERG